MKTVSFRDLTEADKRSPAGKFHSYCRDVSLALGGIRNVGTWGGGHPFDFQIRRVPPGASICPYHGHLGQWEAFFVRAGHGTVRASSKSYPVKTDDVFVHPPLALHQLTNTGTTDLEVFIFADNPPMDGCYYPDSGKWGLRQPGFFFRATEADYFDGEEPGAPSSPPNRPTPVPQPPPDLPPFDARRINIDDLPWDPWRSPKLTFRGESKELSVALGARRNAPTGLGGHPFDLELCRLAPGERGNPFHCHAAQWEMFIFLEGTATVRAGDERQVLHGGEVVLHPAMEAHEVRNTGETDLLYLLVADNPPVDYWYYPDSDKWGLRAPRKFFRLQEVDYYDGEE
jgi:uncharacterized cupin superfamily protein